MAIELAAFVRRCLGEANYAIVLGRNAAAVVQQQQGATRRTWEMLETLLPHTVRRLPMPHSDAA